MRWFSKCLTFVFVTAFFVCSTACAANPAAVAASKPTEPAAVGSPSGASPAGAPSDTRPEALFDFYTVPNDWPRVVPLMSEFKVTAYEWSGTEMAASGYGDVPLSRASNFYTNAQKKHVSSNIWEQDPKNPSVTEGTGQIFSYVGEGNTLQVVITQTDDDSVVFELYFRAKA